MKLLLDTHIFLWYISGDSRLPTVIKDSIRDPNNEAYSGLPSFHRDPFDRLLICQAIQHGLTIATVDPVVQSYPISVL